MTPGTSETFNSGGFNNLLLVSSVTGVGENNGDSYGRWCCCGIGLNGFSNGNERTQNGRSDGKRSLDTHLKLKKLTEKCSNLGVNCTYTEFTKTESTKTESTVKNSVSSVEHLSLPSTAVGKTVNISIVSGGESGRITKHESVADSHAVYI